MQVLAALRLELFRTLLLQKVEFFDRHSTSQLTSLLSVELDNIRSFVFGNVSRDRGLRAILEASGSVIVLFVLSWRLGPVLGLVIVATAVTAALYRQQTKQVEIQNSTALAHMVGVADQAFAAIRTVRCVILLAPVMEQGLCREIVRRALLPVVLIPVLRDSRQSAMNIYFTEHCQLQHAHL